MTQGIKKIRTGYGGANRVTGPSARSRRAFTLIEVMIVIAIILALSGLVAVAVFQRRDDADIKLTRVSLNNLKSAMGLFKLDYRRYPFEEEGLAVLWDREMLDPESDENLWKTYLEAKMDTDVWGTEWGYRADSETRESGFDLWSNGPDKEEGTDDDIMLFETDEDDDFGFGSPSGGGG